MTLHAEKSNNGDGTIPAEKSNMFRELTDCSRSSEATPYKRPSVHIKGQERNSGVQEKRDVSRHTYEHALPYPLAALLVIVLPKLSENRSPLLEAEKGSKVVNKREEAVAKWKKLLLLTDRWRKDP
ncbi:hypothetical protein M0804_004446 [Polistes exclamans]|nr:hypothetical protein M0804_004446 [Polistes exclamans]